MEYKGTGKLFLDDVRDPPDDSWTVVRTAKECIFLLENLNFEVLSLDHDLGEDMPTGYDVAVWIEERVALMAYQAPEIRVHSANPVGVKRIRQVIASIERLKKR